MKTPKLLIIFLLLGFTAKAQVGVNTLNPDSSAILHIYSDNKGVLLPIVGSGQRASRTLDGVETADGLLVYDSLDKIYYFFNSKTREWLVLNPFQAPTPINQSNSNNPKGDVRLADSLQNRNVVIGGGNAISEAKLHVHGDIKSTKGIYADDSIWSPKIESLSLKTGTADINDVLLADSIHATTAFHTNTIHATTINTTTINPTTVNATTVNATTVTGHGTIPIGGIIMWSGDPNNLPNGWRLCVGGTAYGITIPDLRGRFIVGYHSGITDYNEVGKTGGEEQVRLAPTQIPDHTHCSWTANIQDGGTGNRGRAFVSNNPPNTSLSPEIQHIGRGTAPGPRAAGPGAGLDGSPHENRPPYYTLAFIIRVQ